MLVLKYIHKILSVACKGVTRLHTYILYIYTYDTHHSYLCVMYIIYNNKNNMIYTNGYGSLENIPTQIV